MKMHVIAALFITFAITSLAQESKTSYRLEEGWAKLPEGVPSFGENIGLEVDADGNLWVFQRCFAADCVGRDDVPSVLKYDPSGKLVDSWGEGLFVWPHGFYLDADGNIWTSDARGQDGKGHQVIKFTPEGKELMRLGKAGVAGEDADLFNGPCDVVVAGNGDIFVVDGHGNNRIVKFSKDGTFIKAWGKHGTESGDFNGPHCIALDSKGRLFVGDRSNQRIQIFDQEGTFLDEWQGISASGIFITPDDIVFVADAGKGIVIAKTSDFSTIGLIEGTHPEGVAVDAMGNVYSAETGGHALKKFVKN